MQAASEFQMKPYFFAQSGAVHRVDTIFRSLTALIGVFSN